MAKVVLITGCSTGIGRNLAQRLSQAGYTVVATARQVDSMKDLPAALHLPLDVSQPDSVNKAVEQTIAQFGRIDVLVNNAGYAVTGVLEEVTEEKVKQVFDVNVFGVIRMIQAVVPHMRKQGAGRIINISSIAGKMSTPANGAYSATKFALEALSDALRVELTSFGIQVVVVEPGSVCTNFDQTVRVQGAEIRSNLNSPYKALYKMSDDFAASMIKTQCGPEIVSQVIQQAIESPRPKARYLAGVAFLGRIAIPLRDFVWDSFLERTYRVEPQKE